MKKYSALEWFVQQVYGDMWTQDENIENLVLKAREIEAIQELKNVEKKFVIDFFELAFLTESCLPKQPIARHSFFMDTIDKHYFKMTWQQRKHFFEWISPNLDMTHEESKIFYARYNPENQYKVSVLVKGKEEFMEAFLIDDKYMIKSNIRLNDEYFLTKPEKINV
jgi:hypothetical protein